MHFVSSRKMKSYLVARTTAHEFAPLSISSQVWADAFVLNDFSFPWEVNVPTAHISFCALHDANHFYWKFEAVDTNVKTYSETGLKEEVLYGDRVEIFFAQQLSLENYYCLEIDPHGRVYDYHASYYRKFNPAWHWPLGHLKIFASQTGSGYIVSGAITLKSLADLNLIHNNTIFAGLYRGKCIEASTTAENMKWISWVKPESPVPDFHIPSSFGIFQLE